MSHHTKFKVLCLFQLFAWGYNGNGQLGVGNNANQLTPCKVIGLVGTITTQVRTGLEPGRAIAPIPHCN